ncbi:MAG: hypothetical protein O3A63_10245 [Proteobacteria bacterium]|nr:hypothetical protein [Pseudomonadota bacterium]
MIYEIRNYYFEPTRLADYRDWIQNRAIGYLKANLDLKGFWINTPEPQQVNGVPMDDLGSANITWILGWDNLEERNAKMATVFTGPEWEAIFKHVPGGMQSYLRTEVKFADQMA